MLKKFKNPLFVVFMTVFIDLIGFGILIPIIPLLVAEPQSPFFLSIPGSTPDEIKTNSLIIFGFLTAAFPLAQFLASPILGQLSDKFGRKKILAISLVGTCLSYVIFAIGILTKNIPLLFASRILDGATGGNISVAQAAIADISTPETRAKNFGLIGAAFGLGFVLGPYLGGKLADPTIVSWFDATTPFWFAAILSFINILSVIFIFPETNKHIDNSKKIILSKSIKNIVHALTMPNLRLLFITIFIYTAGFTFFTTFANLFFIERLHINPASAQSTIADIFSYVGIWIAFSQAVVTRNVAKFFKEHQVLRFSFIGTGIGLLLLFFSTEWWHLWVILPFFAICNGLTMANVTALVSRSAEPKVQGEVLGINASVQALGQSISPILSGFIASWVITIGTFQIKSAESPILISSIVIAIAGFTFITLYRFKRTGQNTQTTVTMSH